MVLRASGLHECGAGGAARQFRGHDFKGLSVWQVYC